MGGIYSRLTRPIRTFNIENRAERVISREKPIPAPQYASTEKQRKLVDEVNPEFLEKHYEKNIQLDQRLKDVFVTSTDLEKVKPETKSTILPQIRESVDEFNFDYFEPKVIPEGKCTLRQAYTFMSQHKDDPIKYSSENIAAKYKIDKQVIDNILKHFKIYVSVIPTVPDETTPDPLQKVFDYSYAEYQKVKKLKEEQKK